MMNKEEKKEALDDVVLLFVYETLKIFIYVKMLYLGCQVLIFADFYMKQISLFMGKTMYLK